MLWSKIALVTGASRGIGRGIALQLGTAGATVYVTGRKPSKKTDDDLSPLEKVAQEITDRGGRGIAEFCDHSDANEIKLLFEKISKDQDGQLDILVNNAFSAVLMVMENEGSKFWLMDPLAWDEVNNVGLRNHYICSVYAARLMVPRKSGLIVNISSTGGFHYVFNVPFGVGKEACDRMAKDCAIELKPHNVAFVSLWPGAVKTELITPLMEKPEYQARKDFFEAGETIEYSGKCVVELAKGNTDILSRQAFNRPTVVDPNIMQKSGKILITADLGDTYGFLDIDGRRPPCIRSVKKILEVSNYKRLASWLPYWVKIPGFIMNSVGNKF